MPVLPWDSMGLGLSPLSETQQDVLTMSTVDGPPVRLLSHVSVLIGWMKRSYVWDLLQSILWGGEKGGGIDELDWSELLTTEMEHESSIYHSLCFCVCSKCSMIKRHPKCQGHSIQHYANPPHALD